MLHFECDYLMGAHPKILEKLIETNMEPYSGYGNDPYTAKAKKKILDACECPDGEVFFLTGGTQTNKIVIDSMLASYEGVLSAISGHINQHEAGAIEASGHKVLAINGHDGKLCAKDVEKYLKDFFDDGNREHMVFPGMVYISNPTEYGTIYTANELKELHNVCKQYNISLFIDGARLGYGLMNLKYPLTLKDIADNCDVFYIGGTKVGALCGEAVVFPRKNSPKHFFTFIKQNGALLAKGRLLSIQFDTLFTDGLYFEISRHAIEMAEKLKEVFTEKGYKFFIDSPTNQQFIILSLNEIEALKEKVSFDFWEKTDDTHAAVRFATSWATTEDDINALKEIL